MIKSTCQTIEDVIALLMSKLQSNDINLLQDLYKNRLLIFDYSPTLPAENNNFTKQNGVLIANRNIVYNIAEKMSSNGWFVGLYDPMGGAEHIYREGIMYSCITQNWDYNAYIDMIKNLINNDKLFKCICKEYVIVSIVQSNFSDKDLLLDLVKIAKNII